MEKEKNYLGRGLRQNLFDLITKGKLKPLIDAVNKRPELVIQIRDNYFNIYYLGGSVAKVVSEKSVIFDKNYFNFYQPEDKLKKISEAHQYFKEGRFNEYLDIVINAMKDWESKVGKNCHEKRTQHELCIQNLPYQSDYTIIDLEYQVSTLSQFKYIAHPNAPYKDKRSPRFDIIAVKNADHKLCIIELKEGLGAIYGKSGIIDHIESFSSSIGREPQAFIKEMQGVLKQKGEICSQFQKVFIDETKGIEFLFAYKYSNEKKQAEERQAIMNEQKKDTIFNAADYKVLYLKEYALQG